MTTSTHNLSSAKTSTIDLPDLYDLFIPYRVSLTVDRLTAGIPANPKLMQAWLEVNGVAGGEAEADLKAMLERLDPEQTHGVVFYRADDSDRTPCYEGRNFKAALKEGANILKGVLEVKAFKSKLAERVFPVEKLVPITVPIQSAERPISVMTAQGPRTSIKRYEYADNVDLTFTLNILDDGVVTAKHIATILVYLQENGIGADRSQGSGTFTLHSFEKLEIG